MEINIGNIIVEEEINLGDLELDVVKEYPKLENLTVTPKGEQQTFNHPNSYGYDNVVVEAVPSESLEVMPSAEEQNFNGLYKSVKVSGDSNLIPQNIKRGVDIFEVTGTGEMATFEINDASYLISSYRTNCLEELLGLCKNVTKCENMFYYCKLSSIDLSNFDGSKVTTLNGMCSQCVYLVSLDLSNFDFSSATNISYMLNGCSALENLKFGINLGKGYTQKRSNYASYRLELNTCTNLTHDSLMSVINGLYDLNLTYDVANGGTLYTQTLQISSESDALLSEEEKAIAINKGWTIAVSS